MSGYSILNSKDIIIEINGLKIAAAESYSVAANRSCKTVGSIGSKEGTVTVTGRAEYTVEITKLCLLDSVITDGIDTFSLSNFFVTIVLPDKRIVFGGCEWESVTENATLSGSVIEKLRIKSRERKCYFVP